MVEPGKRVLMVATISRTLEAFMIPHVNMLRSAGWAVDALAAGVSASPAAAGAFDAAWEIGWSRSPLALANIPAVTRVRDVVRAGRYDLVHVQTPVAAFITRLALGRPGGARRPVVVYTAHGFHFHDGAGRLRNLVYGTLERLAGRWTDELVVINEEDRAAATRRRLVNPDHLHLIPGVGIDPRRFDPTAVSADAVAEMYEMHQLPRDVPFVVTIAELNRNKNLSFLIEGLSRMRNDAAQLVVVGVGPERSRLGELAVRRGMSRRVHFVGFSSDVRPFLKAASAFALVSLREGLPVSMMEAMSMGTPVIGSDTRGIRDLAADGRGIVVRGDEPQALADAIDELLDHPAAAAERAARARRYVRSELSIERISLEYQRLYETTLAAGRASPRA